MYIHTILTTQLMGDNGATRELTFPVVIGCICQPCSTQPSITFTGSVSGADTGAPVEATVYITGIVHIYWRHFVLSHFT